MKPTKFSWPYLGLINRVPLEIKSQLPFDVKFKRIITIKEMNNFHFQITLTVQRVIQPKISSPIIRHQTPPKNDSHLIKLISGESPVLSKPDLKNVPHVALFLTITSSEEENEPDQVCLWHLILYLTFYSLDYDKFDLNDKTQLAIFESPQDSFSKHVLVLTLSNANQFSLTCRFGIPAVFKF